MWAVTGSRRSSVLGFDEEIEPLSVALLIERDVEGDEFEGLQSL